MRVAPVGLYCGTMCLNADAKQSREFDGIAAMAAAVTHGHELGYIPAVGLARIVALAAHLPALDLDDIVVAARDDLAEFFSGKRHLPEMLQLIDQARELARRDDLSDVEAIGRLGEGWVAEETLAIAIYCALRYRDDFAKAIIAAVNHSGDSDSTGSVTGNILGAYLGERAIPQSFLEHLEGRDTIIEVAEELYRDIPSGWERILAGNLEGEDPEAVAWFNKYVDGQDCLEYYP